MLARALVDRNHAARGTSRDPRREAEIEAAGAEAVIADPDRVATLVGALEHVTVVCILLGSATGGAEQLDALHGARLEMLLTKLVDTTVHGVVYEAAGSVDRGLLRAGSERVSAFCTRSHASCVLIEADPADGSTWLKSAIEAVEQVLAPR